MIKAPQFMIRYANFRITAITNNELMKDEYKRKKIRTIDRIISAYEAGMITVDEAMQGIAEA